MSRLAYAVFGFLALGIVAMATTDTSSSTTQGVWHVYASKTPLAP